MPRIGILFLFVFLLFSPSLALAHCDTLDGPVVKDAKAALETKDVTPVLKWVAKEREEGVKAAFDNALK